MTTNMRTIITNQNNLVTGRSKWGLLYSISSLAAISVGVLFLAAAVDLTLKAIFPDIKDTWLSSVQDNWLIIIFKLQAGFSGIQADILYRRNLLDILILALIAVIYIGLYLALKGTSKIWSMVAMAQLILGLLLFIITSNAGRSGVMGAELVISIVMLRSKYFNKQVALAGISSAVLLLAGDFGVSLAPSTGLAVLTGIGYILLVFWFFWVARLLFSLGKRTAL